MNEEDIFLGLGVEVTLKDNEDNFRLVRETLTRIGIASRKDDTLYQSAHILHKRGRYAIMHFKELFILDGKESNFSEEDLARRNTIANLLVQWNLVDLINPEQTKEPLISLSKIKVLSFADKANWELVAKYSIGNAKR